MQTFIFVTAGPDRQVPIPADEGSSPGGMQLRCTPGKVYRLPYSTYTRKRLASGDLLLTNREGMPVAERALAAAPDVVELDDTGAVAIAAKPAPAPTKPIAPTLDTPKGQ